MRYPKECFSIDENATRNAMREYEHKRDLWYAEAVKLYPNYWQMEFMERVNVSHEISDSVGFDIRI